MRILFLSYHCCIRVAKEYWALKAVCPDVEIHCCQTKVANGVAQYSISPLSFYHPTEELLEAHLRTLGRFDVVHVHNEPNWLARVARRVFPDTPLVFDAHDLDSMRFGEFDEEEYAIISDCDGLVFPSVSYAVETRKRYQLEHKHAAIVLSACNRSVMQNLHRLQPFPRLPYLDGVVYEGGVSVTGLKWEDNASITSEDEDLWRRVYRDYRPIAHGLAEKDIPFAIYGVAPQLQPEYHAAGAICFPSMPYLNMLAQLSRWSWGLVGCPVDHPQWHTAMPNKFFEYIAAGIPILVHKAHECAHWVNKCKLGIVLDSLDDIKDPDSFLKDADEYKPNVWAAQKEFSMENEVLNIVKLYEGLGVNLTVAD